MNGSIVATSPCEVRVTRSAAPWLRSSSSTWASSGAKWAGTYIPPPPHQPNGQTRHEPAPPGPTHHEIVGNIAVTRGNRRGTAALYPGGCGGHFRWLPARRGLGRDVRGPRQAPRGLRRAGRRPPADGPG